jgi:hypothetical protein
MNVAGVNCCLLEFGPAAKERLLTKGSPAMDPFEIIRKARNFLEGHPAAVRAAVEIGSANFALAEESLR